LTAARRSHRKTDAAKARRGGDAEPPPPAQPAWRSIAAWIIFLSTAGAGAVADLVTKHIAFDRLMHLPSQSVTLIPKFLGLRLSTNPGIVGGLMGGRSMVILLANLVAVAAVIALFVLSSRRLRTLQVALGMILGGAAGNMYDRLATRIDVPGREPLTGVVRDFIDLHAGAYHWPTFNVADVLLVVGVGLFVFHAFRHRSGKGE